MRALVEEDNSPPGLLRTYVRIPMQTLLSTRDLRALADGEPRGVDALNDAFKERGWRSGMTPLGGPGRRAVWELSIATEPSTIVAFGKRNHRDRLGSMAYTRQARYAIKWSRADVVLFDVQRWKSWPGDLPVVTVAADDLEGIRELLQVLGRDLVLDEAPSDLIGPVKAHEALPKLLGDALRRLRLDVANNEAYQQRDPAGRDTAVLRLFHQILYARVAEDRKHRGSSLSVREILNSENVSADLNKLLLDYRTTANSEIYQPAGIAIDALPSDSLRDVLRQTVEPWERLHLDFSVARSDLAGRLYESYLSALPAEERTESPAQRLFPVALGIDRREKQATFYTPPALAGLLTERALAKWVERHAAKPSDIRIIDPACGSGAFLIAAYAWLHQHFEHQKGRPLRPAEREELLLESIFGADVDERALGLAQVQLLEVADLRGRLPSFEHNLYCGDSLPAPPGHTAKRGQIDWDQIVQERGLFTTVLGNPPFGAQAKLPERLSIDTISQLSARYPEIKAFGQDYAYLFLSLGAQLLVPDGTAALVMPRGLLALGQGAAARAFLAALGVDWIADLRGARVFPDVAASVAAIAFDKSIPADAEIAAVVDSRIDGRAVLDDLLAADSSKIVRRLTTRAELQASTRIGWTPFRLRWAGELSSEMARPTTPLGAASNRMRCDIRTGVKTARVADFVIEPSAYRLGLHGRINLGERQIPGQYLPPIVYASDITPFDLRDSGKRLLLPFNEDGSRAKDPYLIAELESRGGLPSNYQHGYLPTLLAPKVLLRAFAREPAAVADQSGQYVPIMRGVHALGFRGLANQHLAGIAALLNSALYQWFLRGLGAPRSDETVEISVLDVSSLPFPDLTAVELRQLKAAYEAVLDALDKEGPVERAHAVRAARASVDLLAFELLGVSTRLQGIVRNELLRVA